MGKVRNSANRLGFHYGLFSFLFVITKFNFITMKTNMKRLLNIGYMNAYSSKACVSPFIVQDDMNAQGLDWSTMTEKQIRDFIYNNY